MNVVLLLLFSSLGLAKELQVGTLRRSRAMPRLFFNLCLMFLALPGLARADVLNPRYPHLDFDPTTAVYNEDGSIREGTISLGSNSYLETFGHKVPIRDGTEFYFYESGQIYQIYGEQDGAIYAQVNGEPEARAFEMRQYTLFHENGNIQMAMPLDTRFVVDGQELQIANYPPEQFLPLPYFHENGYLKRFDIDVPQPLRVPSGEVGLFTEQTTFYPNQQLETSYLNEVLVLTVAGKKRGLIDFIWFHENGKLREARFANPESLELLGVSVQATLLTFDQEERWTAINIAEPVAVLMAGQSIPLGPKAQIALHANGMVKQTWMFQDYSASVGNQALQFTGSTEGVRTRFADNGSLVLGRLASDQKFRIQGKEALIANQQDNFRLAYFWPNGNPRCVFLKERVELQTEAGTMQTVEGWKAFAESGLLRVGLPSDSVIDVSKHCGHSD